MKTVKDYHDLYLNCGVLLLTDVFEKFRNKSLNNCRLCPSHYLSAPSLSWDAILNMTKVELKLIIDSDMNVFFEKDVRDGVSYISNRHSACINQYLNSYHLKEESKHIIYLVANS